MPLARADAFAPVAEAFLHPRCTNCHVGASGVPGWAGLGLGPAAVHGMNVRAGASRIGAEGLPCRTCHVTAALTNDVPRAAPGISVPWHLPPVTLAWQGADPATLCARLKDPAQTDGAGIAEIAAHVQTSPFVAWGFAPGGGRSAPVGSPDTLAQALLDWAAAGAPCS